MFEVISIGGKNPKAIVDFEKEILLATKNGSRYDLNATLYYSKHEDWDLIIAAISRLITFGRIKFYNNYLVKV